jgi:hypothetical protein
VKLVAIGFEIAGASKPGASRERRRHAGGAEDSGGDPAVSAEVTT